MMYALSQGHGQGTPALVSEETCLSCCLGDFGTGMLVLSVCPVFYFVQKGVKIRKIRGICG